MLKSAIEKLILRQDLSFEECANAIDEILKGAHPNRAAAFLVLLRAKGETIEEIDAVIATMRKKMIHVTACSPVLDIVGTGGDGMHTLNISTASALLAASCGVKVAKHGNRSVSSLCGSADVIEMLGIPLEQTGKEVAGAIKEVGIGFMYAPLFHPAMAELKEVRRALGVRTCFNLIGPLLNPANAEHLMIGVYNEELLPTVAALLQRQKKGRSFVFHGSGLDELSCMGPAKVLEIAEGEIRPFVLDPQEYGLKRCTLQDLQGKDARYNAEKILRTLQGEPGAFTDTIALNAGAALYLYGTVSSIKEGIALAAKHLKEKKTMELLDAWRGYAKKLPH